jgi:3-hydroxyisobutyrate dehydrogenase-like beta-hydroxyacid dehydrogenase
VGGDAACVARVNPLLGTLGRKMFHRGSVGSGHAMKSINNLIASITFLATAEGLVIGKACGLDPATMVDVLYESTGMSWIRRTHISQRILNRRFGDPFKFDLMVKDMAIALVCNSLQKAALPGLTRSLFEIGRHLERARGHGKLWRASLRTSTRERGTAPAPPSPALGRATPDGATITCY